VTAAGHSRADLPGLQAERTILAGDRTALGLLGNGALLLVRGPVAAGAGGLVAAALALIGASLVAVLARPGRVLAAAEGRGPAPPIVLVGGVVATVEVRGSSRRWSVDSAPERTGGHRRKVSR
jgi:uncharacterized membrane protein YidH (DUF202 family)